MKYRCLYFHLFPSILSLHSQSRVRQWTSDLTNEATDVSTRAVWSVSTYDSVEPDQCKVEGGLVGQEGTTQLTLRKSGPTRHQAARWWHFPWSFPGLHESFFLSQLAWAVTGISWTEVMKHCVSQLLAPRTRTSQDKLRHGNNNNNSLSY